MILLTRADFEESIESFINESEKVETQWMLTNIPMLNYKYLQRTSHIPITFQKIINCCQYHLLKKYLKVKQ
ncbi:unnamed protein product [Cunninghamella echinulata]